MRRARQTGPQKTAISGPFNHFLHPTQRPAPPQPPKSLAAINRNPQSDRLLEAAAAYGVKDTFVRRVSYRKTNLEREDRGECWNTRGRILRGDAWVELMLFLDRIGLQRRLVLSARHLSVPPLHSRDDPRLGGSK